MWSYVLVVQPVHSRMIILDYDNSRMINSYYLFQHFSRDTVEIPEVSTVSIGIFMLGIA